LCDREPLVPVTPIWNVPVDVKVQESVDVPEPVTLVGERVQNVLLVDRLTTAEKPLIAVMVMVELPGAFALTLRLVGFAAIVKSWTTNVTVTEWVNGLLVPVTATCLLPVVLNVQDKVALPDPVTLVGETEHDEVVFVTRLTIAENPSSPVIVMLDVAGLPTSSLMVVGLDAIVKSWTV
jgi:hypothetical protein